MIKCRVDNTTNIKRRAVDVLKILGRLMLWVGGFVGLALFVVWVSTMTENWAGWFWVGSGVLVLAGTICLGLAYMVLHWLICVDD